MKQCETCGSTFDDYDVVYTEECVGFYGSAPAFERWMSCPYCRSTDIIDYNGLDEDDEYVASSEDFDF